MLSFFPRGVLGEILNLIESVSEGFPSYFFMSGVFQQVMHELGIEQYRSSAYNPESQGALERFHQTLKNMIRSYCFDTEKDWDEGIRLLLFAVRESVQESRFQPF